MADPHDRPTCRETDHTADLRVEIEGGSPEELLLRAGESLYDLLGLPAAAASAPGPGGASFGPSSLAFSGTDEADLLVQYLGELLAVVVTERRRWVPREGSCRFAREGDAARLMIEGHWRRLTRQETALQREIKAVTYHDARFRRQGNRYIATVVMDV